MLNTETLPLPKCSSPCYKTGIITADDFSRCVSKSRRGLVVNYTFLLNEWKEQAYAHIIHERHVYVGHLGECRHFYVEDGVVRHETIDVLGCNHAEADTRICLHDKVIDDVGNANNIIKRASDTVIAAIIVVVLRSEHVLVLTITTKIAMR